MKIVRSLGKNVDNVGYMKKVKKERKFLFILMYIYVMYYNGKFIEF